MKLTSILHIAFLVGALILLAFFCNALINNSKEFYSSVEQKYEEDRIRNKTQIQSLNDSIASLHNQRQPNLIELNRLDSIATLIDKRISQINSKTTINNYEMFQINPQLYADSSVAVINESIVKLLDSLDFLRLRALNKGR